MEEKNKEISIEEKSKSQEDKLEINSEPIPKQDNENIEFENEENSVNEHKKTSEHLEDLSTFVNAIKEDLILRNERDKYKDEAIQRMSKQIADFEKGIFEKIKKELINEIISFYDLLLKFQEKFKSVENKELQNEIDFLETEISNILFNNSIDEIDESIGEDVNRDLHRIKKKVESNDKDKNQKILEVLKKGFIWNNKVIRKQEVIITEFKEKENIDE